MATQAAHSGLQPTKSLRRLFDHLVGAGEQGRCHFGAERLAVLRVDCEFGLGRHLYRPVGGARTAVRSGRRELICVGVPLRKRWAEVIRWRTSSRKENAIPVVTIHSGNRQDSRLSLAARGAPPAAAPAFSVSHRRACPRAPLAPRCRWPASLTSRQGALAVREERREPQPASWSRAAAGREPPRGFWLPKAPRTNERPWQERRRPRGSCRPLPTRTIHDAVTYYAHTFGRPHA
jgi:hypothetical protein